MNPSSLPLSHTIRNVPAQATQKSRGPLWAGTNFTVTTRHPIKHVGFPGRSSVGAPKSSPASGQTLLWDTVHQASKHARRSKPGTKRLSIVPYIVTDASRQSTVKVAAVESGEVGLSDHVVAPLDANVLWTSWDDFVSGLGKLVEQGKAKSDLEVSLWEPVEGAVKLDKGNPSAELLCSLYLDRGGTTGPDAPVPESTVGYLATTDTPSLVAAMRSFASSFEPNQEHLVDDTWDPIPSEGSD